MVREEDENILQTITRCREIELQLSTSLPRSPPHTPHPMTLSHFTPTPTDSFPLIHQANPAQALDAFPTEAIQRWLAEPGFKFIARIVDYDSRANRTQTLPTAVLTAALTAITPSAPPGSPPPYISKPAHLLSRDDSISRATLPCPACHSLW